MALVVGWLRLTGGMLVLVTIDNEVSAIKRSWPFLNKLLFLLNCAIVTMFCFSSKAILKAREPISVRTALSL